MTEPMNIAAEFAKLRGDMATGLARIEGQLNLIAEAQRRDSVELDELDRRVTALEARRVPLGMLAAVSGAVSAVVAAGAFLVQI